MYADWRVQCRTPTTSLGTHCMCSTLNWSACSVCTGYVFVMVTQRLINYSWRSTTGKVCCKLLQDTSWDLETPEKAELGSDTLEQSLLPWLNVVKLETTQLLQCLDERFLVYFSCVSFACCALLLTIYPAQSNCTNPCAGPECKIFTREVTVWEQESLCSGSCRKSMAVLKLIGRKPSRS